MTESSYLIGIVILGFVYFILFRRCSMTTIRKINDRIGSIKILGDLNTLLHDLQQHRGMSGALISGDTSFKQARQIKQQDIDAIIRRLDKTMLSVLENPGFWKDILADWEELKSQLGFLNSQQSFTHHTRVILRLLDVMEEFGDAVNLTTVSDSLPRNLSELIVSKLPGLTERLGQARALGTSAVAEGLVSTVVGMRLTFLSSQISASLEQIEGLLNDMNHAKVSSMLNGLAKVVTVFQEKLEAELIHTRVPEIRPDDYFKMATATIDEVYSLYGRLSPMLIDFLSQQTHSARRRQVWTSMLIGTTLTGMSGFVFAKWLL